MRSLLWVWTSQWRATLDFDAHLKYENEKSRYDAEVKRDSESGRSLPADRDLPKERHDKWDVTLIYIVPVVVGLASASFFLIAHRRIDCSSISDALLASLAIFAGALISAFGLLATWRSSVRGQGEMSSRWRLDCASAHLLAGAQSSAIASLVAVLVKMLTGNIPGVGEKVLLALVLALGAHVAVSLLVALPELYVGYVELNDVEPILNATQPRDTVDKT